MENRHTHLHPVQFLHPSFPVGFGGVYQGLTATILKQGSNQAIRFFVYNNLKKRFQGGDNSKDIGTIKTLLCGGLAGAASVFGNTPIDVIKTRMQVQSCVYGGALCLYDTPSP